MSRSFRVPAYYNASNVDPAAGKRRTSQALRALIRAQLRNLKDSVDDETLDDIDVHLDDPRDVNRGSAGSKSSDSSDYGWDDFGDGRSIVWDPTSWSKDDIAQSFLAKLRRK